MNDDALPMKDERHNGAPRAADRNSTHDQPFTPEGATAALHSNEAQFTMARNIYRHKPHLAICELIAGTIDCIQTTSAASDVTLLFSEGFRDQGFLVGNTGIRGLQDPINAMNHGFSDVSHDARCEGKNGCALKDAKMAVADSFITISSLGDGMITLILHTKHLHENAQTCYYMITYKDRKVLPTWNAPVSSDKNENKQVGYTSQAQLDGFLRHLGLDNVSALRPLLKWASKLLAEGGLLHYFYDPCNFVKVNKSEGGSIVFDDIRPEDEKKLEWTRDLKKVIQAKLIGAPANIKINWFGTTIEICKFAWDRHSCFLEPPGITEVSADDLQAGLQGSLPQGVEATKMITGFHEDIVSQCAKYQQEVNSKRMSWRAVMSSVPTGVIIINETKSRMTAMHSFPATSDRLYKNSVAGRCNLSIVYLKDPEQKLEKGADSGSYENEEMPIFYKKVCGIAAASAKAFLKCGASKCHAHAESMFSAQSALIACRKCRTRCHAECLVDGDHCESCDVDVAEEEEHVPTPKSKNKARLPPKPREPPPAPPRRRPRPQASPQTQVNPQTQLILHTQLIPQSPNTTPGQQTPRPNRAARRSLQRPRRSRPSPRPSPPDEEPSPPDEEPSPPTQTTSPALQNDRKRKIEVATTARVLRRIILGDQKLAEELQAEWNTMDGVPQLALLGEWFPEPA